MLRYLHHVDRTLLFTTCALAGFGFFIFISASLGLLARGNVSLISVVFNQLLLGLFGGSVLLYAMTRVKYTALRAYAVHMYVAALLLTACVFLPYVGFTAKGASRWIDLRFATFQPSEVLKIATVLLTASYIATCGKQIRTTTLYSLGGFFGICALPLLILVMQPDIDIILILLCTVASMLFVSGMRFRDVALLGVVGVMFAGSVLVVSDHARSRIETFLHPSSDIRGGGYQIRQSLIAVGSGGMFGKGFGQSTQKFGYLPEPIGDSIFAVYAEEFGFVGALFLLAAICFFGIRASIISLLAKDVFGSMLAFGLAFMIVVQSLVNIAAIVGVLPLSGNPLVFVSHGGSALMFALLSVGIILSVSKSMKRI
jgi:cell division protein FtsW (lipid II flippase)